MAVDDAKPDTHVDLLRHGEPLGGKRYRGQTDDPLSDRGWAQMRTAVRAGGPWDAIVSSPLRRCAEFARELGTNLGVPVSLDERLKEIGFGAWEGRTAGELKRDDPGILQRFWLDPAGNRPAGAEPVADFHRRVTAAWQDLVATHAGRRVLVVGHAGIVRMVICAILGAPPENMFRVSVDNAAITRVRIQHRAGRDLPLLLAHGQGPGPVE